MMSAEYSRASRSSLGKNSTVQSQSFSSCQYGSKSFLRLLPKVVRLLLRILVQKSRYTRGTLCPVPSGSYRALVSDPGLVNTTRDSTLFFFHGDAPPVRGADSSGATSWKTITSASEEQKAHKTYRQFYRQLA